MEDYLEHSKEAMIGMMKELKKSMRTAMREGSSAVSLLTNADSQIVNVVVREMNTKYRDYIFTLVKEIGQEYIIEFVKKEVDDPAHPGWSTPCLEVMKKYRSHFLHRYRRKDVYGYLVPTIHKSSNFYRGQRDYGICGSYMEPPLFHECCLYMKEYIKILSSS